MYFDDSCMKYDVTMQVTTCVGMFEVKCVSVSWFHL